MTLSIIIIVKQMDSQVPVSNQSGEPAPNLCMLSMDAYDCGSGLFHDSVDPLNFLSATEQAAVLKQAGTAIIVSEFADQIGPPLF